MTEKDLLDSLRFVDDDLIEEAGLEQLKEEKQKKTNGKVIFLRTALTAAAGICIFTAGTVMGRKITRMARLAGFSARCCSSARTRSALASTPWARMFMPAACSILSSSASSLRKAAWHSARCSAGRSTSASARKPGVRMRNFRLILKEVTCHGMGFGDWFVCCGDCRDSARHALPGIAPLPMPRLSA